MDKCCQCDEPATWSVTSAPDPQNAVARPFCYLHAAEAGFAEPPPAELLELARQLGYSVNALIFMLDAFHSRAGECCNAMGCCVAVWMQARERFHGQAGRVLRAWKITSGKEIADILFGFAGAGMVKFAEGESPEDFAGLYKVGAIPRDTDPLPGH